MPTEIKPLCRFMVTSGLLKHLSVPEGSGGGVRVDQESSL